MDQSILSKRGKEKFHNDGYVYTFDRLSSDEKTRFYRCERRDCKARIHVQNGNVRKQLHEHTHDASAASVVVAQTITQIKKRAAETMEETAQVINACTERLPVGAQALLPRGPALKKTVRRTRNRVTEALPNPATLQELVIPEAFRLYNVNGVSENFLLADSEDGNDRIIIFGRQQGLAILQESSHWFMDGTFKIAPLLFQQIYIIMAEKYDGVHPVLYSLLPNKRRETYYKLFRMVKQLASDANPESVSCDFELAAIQAIKDVFTSVHIHGCFFHLSQNMQRHLSNIGLRQAYNNDTDFALQCRMIISLAFVPQLHLETALTSLREELTAALQPMLEWFETNYIGVLTRSGNRRPPLFGYDIWNVYDRTRQNFERTNNHAEAANKRIQCELGMLHPTIWKFIDGLRKVQKSRDIYYESLVAGRSPPRKLKKYRDADERILKIVEDFYNRNIIDYLRGLAHNFEMRN